MGVLHKFMPFLFMHSSVSCVIMYGTINMHMHAVQFYATILDSQCIQIMLYAILNFGHRVSITIAS